MPDPWSRLRVATTARIGLARTGDSLRTTEVLALQLAHARARDAVEATLDVAALAAGIDGPVLCVRSAAAAGRGLYVRRPDLGRRLAADTGTLPAGPFDAVFVLADGLSALAAARHGAALLAACRARLEGWSIGPTVLATGGRVALGDMIGARMQASLVVMLIGERPGLSVSDALGAYLTWSPAPGRRDSERNCVSGIRPDGLPIDEAARRIVWLMQAARRRRLTGIGLKDTMALAPAPVAGTLLASGSGA